MKALILLAGLFALAPDARAVTLEGVTVPPQLTVAKEAIPLNGSGVRTFTLAFIPVKAYVAAFYAPAPLDTEQAVLASPGPLAFTFTFLHSVGQEQVTEAWNAQFKASATYQYPGLAADQAKFVALFGPLKKGGIEMVEIVGDETRVYDDGSPKGAIKGRDFQKAFLSMWFGSQPVMPSLKKALLGGG